MTIMDAVLGAMVYGRHVYERARKGTDYDAVVREISSIKQTVQAEILDLKSDGNDGSYVDFDVSVRRMVNEYTADLSGNHPLKKWVLECLDVHFTERKVEGNVVIVDFRKRA